MRAVRTLEKDFGRTEERRKEGRAVENIKRLGAKAGTNAADDILAGYGICGPCDLR